MGGFPTPELTRRLRLKRGPAPSLVLRRALERPESVVASRLVRLLCQAPRSQLELRPAGGGRILSPDSEARSLWSRRNHSTLRCLRGFSWAVDFSACRACIDAGRRRRLAEILWSAARFRQLARGSGTPGVLERTTFFKRTLQAATSGRLPVGVAEVRARAPLRPSFCVHSDSCRFFEAFFAERHRWGPGHWALLRGRHSSRRANPPTELHGKP